MDHHEVSEGGRAGRLPCQALVCARGVGFPLGAPLSGGSWMAKLKLHAIEKPCNTRTGGVFSKTQKKMIQAGFGGLIGGVRAIYRPFNGFKPRQRYQKLGNRPAEPFLEMVAA
jgi:hypothetical protein